MPTCRNCGKKLEKGATVCPYCGLYVKKASTEEFWVSSGDLGRKIKELIHEGNVTKIIVMNEKGDTLLEIPVTVGLVAAVVAPWLTALGVIAATAARCRIAVERREE